jgi:hypothetical protein
MHNRNILRRNGLNTVPRAGHSSLRIGRHEKNSHFHLRKLAPGDELSQPYVR